MDPETIPHIFLQCPKVTQLWAHLNIIPPTPSNTPPIGTSSNLSHNSQWLYNLIHMPSKSIPYNIPNIVFLSFKLWHIWNVRNKNTLDNQNMNINLHLLQIKAAE